MIVSETTSYLGFALTVIRASVAVGSAASTLDLIASLVRRVLATLHLGSFGAGDIGSFGHAFLALNDVEQDFLAVANGAKVLVPVVLCDRRLVDEHVFFGIVTIDEAIAVSNVEPLDLAAHALDDDSLLRCSRRVTASVVVIDIGSDDVGESQVEIFKKKLNINANPV